MKYNILYLLAIVLLFASCDALKPVANNGNNKNDGNLDPVVGKNHRETPVIVTTDNNGEVDTMRWRKPLNDEYPPPITKGGGSTTTTTKTGGSDGSNDTNTGGNDGGNGTNSGVLKSTYNVSVLMPFFADKIDGTTTEIPNATYRSLRYYEGLLLGLRKLEQEGLALNVNVYDTKRSTDVVGNLLQRPELQQADLIVGPVASDNVRLVSKFSADNKKPLVSLNAGQNLAQNNPYYLQASPALATHCEAILKYVKEKYAGKSVVLVSRNNSSEVNRFNYFRQAESLLAPTYGGTPISEHIIEGTSRSYNTANLKNYLSQTDTTIIIIPSWSQGFVYSILRDLSILRRNYPIVVFGMPRWIDFDKIEANYYENLNVHISSSAFIDREDFNTQSFKTSFFDEYGTVPSEESFKGYDFMVYIGRMMKQYGTGFVDQLDTNSEQMMHSKIDFQPVFTGSTSAEGNPTPQQYENRYVNILRFIEYHFQKRN